jgi:16S rRNA processing protein RimM
MDEIFVGKLVNTRGLKGEVKVISNFERKDDVFKVGNYVYINGRSYVITHVGFNKNFILLQFNGINNINEIEFLKGSDIYALKSDLIKNENDYLYSDLVGFEVICKNNTYGSISDFQNNEVNPLLEVDNNGKTSYIPINSDLIENVDLENKKIIVKESGEGLFI